MAALSWKSSGKAWLGSREMNPSLKYPLVTHSFSFANALMTSGELYDASREKSLSCMAGPAKCSTKKSVVRIVIQLNFPPQAIGMIPFDLSVSQTFQFVEGRRRGQTVFVEDGLLVEDSHRFHPDR